MRACINEPRASGSVKNPGTLRGSFGNSFRVNAQQQCPRVFSQSRQQAVVRFSRSRALALRAARVSKRYYDCHPPLPIIFSVEDLIIWIYTKIRNREHLLTVGLSAKEAAKMPATARPDRGRVELNHEECKGCGLCVEACPPKVLHLASRLNHCGYHPAEYSGTGCTGCAICFFVCPEPGGIAVFRMAA